MNFAQFHASLVLAIVRVRQVFLGTVLTVNLRTLRRKSRSPLVFTVESVVRFGVAVAKEQQAADFSQGHIGEDSIAYKLFSD